MVNNEWKNFSVLATGNGEKLENWNDVLLLRPDPQVIWKTKKDLSKTPKLNARYIRSNKGGGHWETIISHPEEWIICWRNLQFLVKPMGFKHTGVFPEQAANWAKMIDLINDAKRPISVLNLFAYTGGATVACLYAGASVTHVDAAKGMVDRAAQNVELNNLDKKKVRFIVDDCVKFVSREIKRGKKYDAVIMDPPSYGKGPKGEMWKIEEKLFELCELCREILSDKPLFFLINSYTTGLAPSVLSNILQLILPKGSAECYEVCLPTEEGIVLPCGSSAIWTI